MIPHEIYNCPYSGCLCTSKTIYTPENFSDGVPPNKSPSWFLDKSSEPNLHDLRFHATFPAVYHRTRSYDGPLKFFCFKRPTGCSFGQQIPLRVNLPNFLRNLRVLLRVFLVCCSNNFRGNFWQYSTTKVLGFPWWFFVALQYSFKHAAFSSWRFFTNPGLEEICASQIGSFSEGSGWIYFKNASN